MTDDVVSALVDEVREFLRAGRVGLYEFFWILRSDNPSLPEDEFAGYARVALDRLLSENAARLVWHVWGNVDYEEEATYDDVDAHAWADPTEKPYLAVVPTKQPT